MAVLIACASSLYADAVVFHLKNGDRVAGSIVSEGTNAVVVTTPWAKELAIPLDQIQRREPPPSPPPAATIAAAPVLPKATTNAPAPAPPRPVVAAVPVANATKPKPKPEWKADIRFGVDVVRGARSRQSYYGQFALTYAQPYAADPSKFFRNRLDYRVDYAATPKVEIANRMVASDKTDLDFGRHAYAYNFIGGGYDDARRVDMDFEVGPGVGYHLVRRTNIVLNVEGGLNYQIQDRQTDEIQALNLRFGNDCTWKIHPRISFSERSSCLMRVDAPEEVQFRLEANLGFKLAGNFSFNLTALDLYDTNPAFDVARNEFQLRSAFGITF